MLKTNKKLISLLVFAAFNASAADEVINITLDLPSTTYGIGALNKQKENLDTCAIFVDNVVKTNSKTATTFKLKPGTYNFHTECFGPVDQNTKRQKYFASEVVKKQVLAGVVNNVNLPLKVVNPKTVEATIISPHVSPGQWKIGFLNGEIKTITLNDNNTFTGNFHDENPPYKLISSNGIDIGQITFDKYTFNLMPTKNVTLSEYEVDTGINVVLEDGGYIYNPQIGLMINDVVDENSQVNIVVKGVPLYNYNLYVKDASTNQLVHIVGLVKSPQGEFTLNSTNNEVNASDEARIRINESSFQNGRKYKIFLIKVSTDV